MSAPRGAMAVAARSPPHLPRPPVSASNLYAVVMAGGSGTRFWPASRSHRPKQYLPIAGGRPMLAQTVERLDGLVPPERVLIVSSADQEALVKECVPQIPAENLVFEPEARNTAAAVALAGFAVAQRDPQAVQLVLPADHVIEPASEFCATMAAGAAEAAESGALICFGIQPTFPATGFGYIQAADVLGERDGHPVRRVQRFVEKPDLERAKAFLDEGGFTWNAGIFAWRSDAILAAFESLEPEMHGQLAGAFGGGASLGEVYPKLKKAPVDVAIMERHDDVRTLPITYRWSDVGSWDALCDLESAGPDGNWQVTGDATRVVTHDASDNLIFAEADEVVALVGVQGLVVVRAGDATLVVPKERAQEVKRIVEALGAEEALKRFL